MFKTYAPTEQQEQTALFQWAKIQSKNMPDLQLLFSIPNGGSRHPLEARNLKLSGVKPGIPDICLPVSRGGYHGLYIELKSQTGKLSEHQKNWLKMLGAQGYAAKCCVGFEEARNTILKYLAQL